MWIEVFLFVGLCVNSFVLLRLWQLITGKLLNEVKTKLTNAMYEALRHLGNETTIQKAMWKYFRQQLNNVYDGYLFVKSNGMGTIKSEAFERDILGDTQNDLSQYYPFAESYIEAVTKINGKNWQKFKENFFYDISTSCRNEHLAILQANVMEVFTKNVSEIYEVFDKTYQHDNTVITWEHKTETEMITFVENALINRNVLKLKLSGTTEDISNVIQLLIVYSTGSELHNKILIISGQYKDYMDKVVKHLPHDETEMNRIRQSLLTVIDEL